MPAKQSLRLATWNINSVRLRFPIVERFVREFSPDVLCLQEIKVDDEKFPYDAFRGLGYEHQAVKGQKAYHGVATLSRLPLDTHAHRDWCGKGDARHVTVTLPGDVELHNFYVPAGGDVPDPEVNDKFAHKLDFFDEMTDCFSDHGHGKRLIMVGDLNVAPSEFDVWSHKQLLKVVSHTPVEVEKMEALQASLDWVDIVRQFTPEPEKLYSWWSYRARDWEASDRGRRLDHIWVTPDIGAAAKNADVVKSVRGWHKPSDHAPVIVDFEF